MRYGSAIQSNYVLNTNKQPNYDHAKLPSITTAASELSIRHLVSVSCQQIVIMRMRMRERGCIVQ